VPGSGMKYLQPAGVATREPFARVDGFRIIALVGALALSLATLPRLVQFAVPSSSGTAEAPAVTRSFDSVAATDGLPIAAQGRISGVLGRGDASYHARVAGSGLALENLRHDFEATFDAEGVRVRAGADRVEIALGSWGFGKTLSPAGHAAPTARDNRIEYRRGPLTEWYVNGPAGLQHGFTLDAPPAETAGPLTLELDLSGRLRPALQPGGDGLALDGSSLRYTGLVAFDADGRELPATLQVEGRTVRLLVVADGAHYPLTVDPFLQQAKLTASDGAEHDAFGSAVAVSGDTVVVGSPQDDVGFNGGQGSAYVFVKPEAGWGDMTQAAKLTASDGAATDVFGSAVAISGDTIVVGAPQDDVLNLNQGSAYVFEKPELGWTDATETAKLSAADGAANDAFGTVVAVSGDTVAVGAPTDDVATTNQGSAYVFVKPASGWEPVTNQTAKLTASDGAANDTFGTSVAVSGDTVAVGAPADDFGPVVNQGSAHVFVRPGAEWTDATQTAKLTASDGAAGDVFGDAVAMSGDTIVAGARLDDVGSALNQGSAYVFVKPGSGWANGTQSARLTASDGAPQDFFATSVGISGDTVVTGAPFDDVGSNANQGSGYVFVKPDLGWANGGETAKLTSSDGAADDQFGISVAIGGSTAVVGSRGDDVGSAVNQGSAYLFLTNQPPSVAAGPDVEGAEGSSIVLDGTVSDPDDDPVRTTWSLPAGTPCTFADATAVDTTIVCTDDGAFTATLTGSDGVNPPVSDTAQVTVTNAPPTATVTAPAPDSPFTLGSAVPVSASFSDAGTSDTHQCAIDWDDDSSADATGTVTETDGSGTCTGSHTYAAPGLYTVSVTITDDDGGSDTEVVEDVVVYDPKGGFVTGSGSITSPAGAYQPDPSASGKASFGVLAKYNRGPLTPTGNTDFKFEAAGFRFASSSYKWLVVTGAKAHLKGAGTVNGASGYSFLVTVNDGQGSNGAGIRKIRSTRWKAAGVQQVAAGAGVDTFRIKVWETSTGAVVYDSQMGDPNKADATTPINNGSITVKR
jgi:hypothetical protein